MVVGEGAESVVGAGTGAVVGSATLVGSAVGSGTGAGSVVGTGAVVGPGTGSTITGPGPFVGLVTGTGGAPPAAVPPEGPEEIESLPVSEAAMSSPADLAAGLSFFSALASIPCAGNGTPAPAPAAKAPPEP